MKKWFKKYMSFIIIAFVAICIGISIAEFVTLTRCVGKYERDPYHWYDTTKVFPLVDTLYCDSVKMDSAQKSTDPVEVCFIGSIINCQHLIDPDMDVYYLKFLMKGKGRYPKYITFLSYKNIKVTEQFTPKINGDDTVFVKCRVYYIKGMIPLQIDTIVPLNSKFVYPKNK